MEHHFNVKIAEMYGIEESIMIHYFYYWVYRNATNEKHYHEGTYWTYNSKKAFSDLFTYMNETKIGRVIKSLEEKQIIKKSNFNEDKWDRTNWYAFTEKGINLLTSSAYDTALLQNDTMDDSKMLRCACESINIINNKEELQLKDTIKELKEKFAEFVKLYKKLTGKTTRSVETEFKDFSTRHKNWMEIVPYLSIAIERETKAREQAKVSRTFFPEPKMLQTYLGKQKAWELYVNVGDDVNALNSEYLPQAYNIHNVDGVWLMTGMYFDGDKVFDGYEDDKRPDGATIKLNNGQGTIMWSATNKRWERK